MDWRREHTWNCPWLSWLVWFNGVDWRPDGTQAPDESVNEGHHHHTARKISLYTGGNTPARGNLEQNPLVGGSICLSVAMYRFEGSGEEEGEMCLLKQTREAGITQQNKNFKLKKFISLLNNTLCKHYCIDLLCAVSQKHITEPLTHVFLPSSQIFPQGLAEEFTLVFTLALKKAALRDTIYLLQISDQQGYPQVPHNSSVPPLLVFICVSLSFAYTSIFTLHLFSPLTPFQFPLFYGIYCALLSIIFGFSSFIHLHCYSCASDDEAMESQRVPIITESLRPDLNTQCVWWMEATSPH